VIEGKGVDYQNLIEQRLRIIKLLILIRYIYELQKSFAAERSEPVKNEAIQHDSKKAFKKPPSQEPPSLHGSFLGLKLSKPSAFADSCFKKSFWLPEGTALGFEAGEDRVRTSRLTKQCFKAILYLEL